MQPGYGYGHMTPSAASYDPVQARAQFITRTYNHLFGAILAFAALEVVFFTTGLAALILKTVTGVSWLLVLGAFMVTSWIASRVAATASSRAAQYLALAAFVVLEAIIFVPLLAIAESVASGTIASAALVTMVGFAGLTAVAFVTKKNFSFLRGLMLWGGIAALLLIVAGIVFGFQLGVFFSVAMVAFAGAAILYDTSNIIHEYPEDRYVGAALALFASVALLFWYVLRIFIASRD